VIAVLALVVLTLRRRPDDGLVRGAWLALAVLAVQVLVGALNVWLDEYELLILLHLALGTLLWATTLGMTLALSPARERAPRRAEAVAA